MPLIIGTSVWAALHSKSILNNEKVLSEMGNALCQMFMYRFKRPIEKLPPFMLNHGVDKKIIDSGLISSISFIIGKEFGYLLTWNYNDERITQFGEYRVLLQLWIGCRQY